MKRSTLLTLLCFITTPVLAEFQEINIQKFQGQYRSPSGDGSASVFQLPAQAEYSKNVSLTIEQNETGYILTTPSSQYDWQDVPEILMSVDEVQWNGLNVSGKTQQFMTNFSAITIKRESSDMSLKNFLLDCRLTAQAHEEFIETLLESCLNGQGTARLDEFQKNDKSLMSNQLLRNFLMAVTPYEIAPLGDTKVEEINLKVSRQAFEASLKTKVVFNTTVKMSGAVFYEQDKSQIRLRLDKAKAGFINVHSQIFEQLEKNQSETLIVQKPWVTIILSK